MKTKSPNTFLFLSACLVFVLATLALASCDTGARGTYAGYVVLYQVGEGQGSAPFPQTVMPGNIIELPGQENMTHPAKQILSGWKANDGTVYNPYYRFVVRKDENFIAEWKAATGSFTISYNTNNGNGATPANQTVQAGNSVKLASGSGLSKSGYTFGGWNTGADGLGISYPAGYSYTPIGNITLYAKWDPSGGGTPNPPGDSTTYTVSFSVNGGSGTTPSPITVQAGSSVNLPSGSGLSRSGYSFGGWSTNTAGTGNNYPAGSAFTPTSNITLYAKWNSSGGINPDPPGTTTYPIDITVDPTASGTVVARVGTTQVTSAASGTVVTITATPASGYTFSSWVIETGYNGQTPAVINTQNPTTFTMFSKSASVNAYFKASTASYPINLSVVPSGGGTAVAKIVNTQVTSAAVGEMVTFVATPAPGYTFSRWSHDASDYYWIDPTYYITYVDMPERALNIIAEFLPSAPVAYSINMVTQTVGALR